MDAFKVTDKPRLLIGVPAYGGSQCIAETLRSIQEQNFTAFHVLISVDNNDEETAHACQPYLSDERFRLVVQDRHLNWDGNINWLMSQEGYEFFCYWQQDDLASPDYLGSLLHFADDNPDFVCAFSDIEWIGDYREIWTCPTVTGFALARALYIFETLNAAPMRGVMRKSAIDRAGPIRRTPYQSPWEDLVWLVKLAREGSLGRVEGPLYYKRRHHASVSSSWMKREMSWKRAVWLEVGLGLLEAILSVIDPSEHETALVVVLERLCCPRDGRFRLYDPSSDRAFALEFLQIARERYGVISGDSAVSDAKDADIVECIFKFWRNRDAAIERFAARLRAELDGRGTAERLFIAHDPATRLLVSGWSESESWGTWSDGPSAEVRLAIPGSEHGWRITLRCRAYASVEHPQIVLVGFNGREHAWCFKNSDNIDHELRLAPLEGLDALLFKFPDAASPRTLKQGNDDRALGIALMNVSIARLDDQAGFRIWLPFRRARRKRLG